MHLKLGDQPLKKSIIDNTQKKGKGIQTWH